jgi:HAD superfamily hydrolase (TIGR01450 family)
MTGDRTQEVRRGIIRPVGSTLLGSPRPLVEEFDVALLDLDGVVYIGPAAVPGVPAALAQARTAGLRLAFVTNNAARPPSVVADHLTELGIAADPAEVVTSAQAAARYLAERLPSGTRVLVVGTTGLEEALRERKLTPVGDATEDVGAVVQGYSPDMDWRLLAEGAVAINRGAPWVATNVDPTVPSPRGPLPGNGSLVAALRHATGAEPVVTGKPDPAMHRESLLRSGARRPIVVGDRLDTDIEGANAVGCPSLLVFSGVTRPQDLLDAPPPLRPTYLADDVAGLLVAHPEPTISGSVVRCGSWEAEATAAGVVLRAAPEPPTESTQQTERSEPIEALERAAAGADSRLGDDALDALRALAVAAWQRRDAADPEADGDADAPVRVLLDEQLSPAASGRARAVLERLGISLTA